MGPRRSGPEATRVIIIDSDVAHVSWLNTVTANLSDGDRLAGRASAMSDFHGRPSGADERAAATDWAAAGVDDGDPGEIAGLSSRCGSGPDLGAPCSPEADGSQPHGRAELCAEPTDMLGRSRVLIA